jgi:hypothetical protein
MAARPGEINQSPINDRDQAVGATISGVTNLPSSRCPPAGCFARLWGYEKYFNKTNPQHAGARQARGFQVQLPA